MKRITLSQVLLVVITSYPVFAGCSTEWNCGNCNSGWITLQCQCSDSPPGWTCLHCNSGTCQNCGECCGRNASGETCCTRMGCPNLTCVSGCSGGGLSLPPSSTAFVPHREPVPAADAGAPPTVVVSPNQTEVAVSGFEIQPTKEGFRGADLSLTNLGGRAVVAVGGQLELHWEGIPEPVRVHHTAHSFRSAKPLITAAGTWHSPGIRVSISPQAAGGLRRVEFQLEYLEFEDGTTMGPDRACFGEYFREQKEEAQVIASLREKLRQGWTEQILAAHLRSGVSGSTPVAQRVFRRLLDSYEQGGFAAVLSSLK